MKMKLRFLIEYRTVRRLRVGDRWMTHFEETNAKPNLRFFHKGEAEMSDVWEGGAHVQRDCGDEAAADVELLDHQVQVHSHPAQKPQNGPSSSI